MAHISASVSSLSLLPDINNKQFLFSPYYILVLSQDHLWPDYDQLLLPGCGLYVID